MQSQSGDSGALGIIGGCGRRRGQYPDQLGEEQPEQERDQVHPGA
jgi:hypothetical protein